MLSKQFEITKGNSERVAFETSGSEGKAFELGSEATRSDIKNIQFGPRFQAHYENTLCYDLAEKNMPN